MRDAIRRIDDVDGAIVVPGGRDKRRDLAGGACDRQVVRDEASHEDEAQHGEEAREVDEEPEKEVFEEDTDG